MLEKSLPVYAIHDFKQGNFADPVFFVNRFEDHIQQNPIVHKPHKHNFYLLLLITQGSGTHTIDFITYPVKPNTVFFLSPGQVHSWQLSPDVKGYILFFNLNFYLLGFPLSKLQYPFFNSQVHKPVLELPINQTTSVISVFNELLQENHTKAGKFEDIIRNYIDILLIRLGRIYVSEYALSNSGTADLSDLQKLENLIELHYKKHEPATFYADHMHLTLKQLNHLVKQALGKSLSDFIQNRVMLEASRLLIHTNLNITQVAAELGYFDNSYFTRVFKKRMGLTPEQFRQQHS